MLLKHIFKSTGVLARLRNSQSVSCRILQSFPTLAQKDISNNKLPFSELISHSKEDKSDKDISNNQLILSKLISTSKDNELELLPVPKDVKNQFNIDGDRCFRKNPQLFPFYNYHKFDTHSHPWLEKLRRYTTLEDDWDSSVVSEVVSLVRKVPFDELTLNEVMSCLWFACCCPSYSHVKLKPLMTILTARSIQLLDTLRDEDYQLAALWFQFYFRSGSPTETSPFLKRFVAKRASVESDLCNLESNKFLFLLFLCGVIRTFPAVHNTVPFNDNHGYVLPPHLTEKLKHMIPHLDLSAVGVIAGSLHKLHICVPENSRLSSLFALALTQIPDKLISESSSQIMNIAKVLNNSLTKPGFQRQIMQKFTHHLHLLPLQTQIRLISLIDDSQPSSCDEFLEHLKASIDLDELLTVRAKDIANLLTKLFRLNFWDREENKFLLNRILQAVALKERIGQKESRNFVIITSLSVKCRVLIVDYVEQIFRATNDHRDEIVRARSNQEYFNVSVNICQKLSTQPDVIKGKISRMEKNVWTMKHILFYIAEMDVNLDIDFPDYQGIRLLPDVRQSLLAVFSADEIEEQASQRIQRLIIEDLQSFLGKEVYLLHLTPHSRFRTIAFCLDPTAADLKALKCDPSEEELLKKVTFVDEPGRQWFAMILLKNNVHKTIATDYQGAVKVFNRHLEKLGYTTLWIRPLTVLNKSRIGKSEEYLREVIMPKIRK